MIEDLSDGVNFINEPSDERHSLHSENNSMANLHMTLSQSPSLLQKTQVVRSVISGIKAIGNLDHELVQIEDFTNDDSQRNVWPIKEESPPGDTFEAIMHQLSTYMNFN